MGVMTTGVLSRLTGVPVKAVRQYADAGLIYSVGRSPAGYRLFEDEALWCVGVIGVLRSLGLTVAEIRDLAGSDEQVGPRLSYLLDAARTRATERVGELQQVLGQIEAFTLEHRAELAGEVDFNTGDPRRGRGLTLTPGEGFRVASRGDQDDQSDPPDW